MSINSASKLSSDDVPKEFSKWLLSMGCPVEKVPSVDKLTELCQGQYYMIWRSLMEHVYPKDIVQQKRLQVFCNDINLYQRKKNVVIPEELLLWQQQKALLDKVTDAENRLKQSQDTLKCLMDKNTSKICERNISHHRVQDLQRRIWLLQRAKKDLQSKKQNLEETRTIANSLCCIQNLNEEQSDLDECIALLKNRGSQQATHSTTHASFTLHSMRNPIASSSVISTQNENMDNDEQLTSLIRLRGNSLWTQLHERRVKLAATLATENTQNLNNGSPINHCTNPQAVLTRTLALHSCLALEAIKNSIHIKSTRARFLNMVNGLSSQLTGEECELFVLKCEQARAEARVGALRALLKEVTSREGVFRTHGDDAFVKNATLQQISAIDKDIERKKEELKRLIMTLTTTESKIYNVRECLVTSFNNFKIDSFTYENTIYKGIQQDFPKESISALNKYFDEKRKKRQNKADLSLECDISNNSYGEVFDTDPRFIDELKIYLKKFNLEKNRKLVLESGEKIWIFESLEWLINRLHKKLLADDIPRSLVRHSFGVPRLRHLVHEVETMTLLQCIVNKLNDTKCNRNITVDLTTVINHEEETVDKIKKIIQANLDTLQKTEKTLIIAQDMMKFWTDNELRNYISKDRTVNGKTYKMCEDIYLRKLSLD